MGETEGFAVSSFSGIVGLHRSRRTLDYLGEKLCGGLGFLFLM